jgi:hypothetical protein
MSGLEVFFITLLSVATLAIAFVAGLVVYKLFQGQR